MPEIIYTDTIGYPEKRNIVDLSHTSFKVEKRLNLFRFPNALYFRYYNKSQQFLLNSHYEPIKTKDIHHFFNTISFGNAPWITTFETLLPRWGQVPEWLERKGVELLAGEKCKKLIAISECTKAIQSGYLNKFPDLKEEIMKKTIVLHPPQNKLIKSYDDKQLDENLIVFTFVGADFFRKGGLQVLKVFERLFAQKAPIKLNIISTLQYGDYASLTTIEDYVFAKEIIKNNPVGISHYNYLSNAKILDLLKKSHIALLPTLADTFGYFVLEAQAAGCPVITTNVRALPEINNNDCGWVINISKDKKGNALIKKSNDRKKSWYLIEEELYAVIISILNNQDFIKSKGVAALERIENKHNSFSFSKKIEEIYRS